MSRLFPAWLRALPLSSLCLLVAAEDDCPIQAPGCAATTCAEGQACVEDIDGQAQCVPEDDVCTSDDDCDQDEHCNAEELCFSLGDTAVCHGLCTVGDDGVGCEAMLCSPDTTCVEDEAGHGHCEPTSSAGCAAALCAPDTICVEEEEEAQCVPFSSLCTSDDACDDGARCNADTLCLPGCPEGEVCTGVCHGLCESKSSD